MRVAIPRVGRHFIYPGAGYAGSGFSKDVRALAHAGQQHLCNAGLLDVVEVVNELQKDHCRGRSLHAQ